MIKLNSTTTIFMILFVFTPGFSSNSDLEVNSEKDEIIVHTVLCWLNEPGNSEAISKILQASASFRTIPGVLDIKAGTSLASKRAIVDSSYDVSIIITFSSQKALEEYQVHPTHKKALNTILKPIVKRFLVYDMVNKI